MPAYGTGPETSTSALDSMQPCTSCARTPSVQRVGCPSHRADPRPVLFSRFVRCPNAQCRTMETQRVANDGRPIARQEMGLIQKMGALMQNNLRVQRSYLAPPTPRQPPTTALLQLTSPQHGRQAPTALRPPRVQSRSPLAEVGLRAPNMRRAPTLRFAHTCHTRAGYNQH